MSDNSRVSQQQSLRIQPMQVSNTTPEQRKKKEGRRGCSLSVPCELGLLLYLHEVYYCHNGNCCADATNDYESRAEIIHAFSRET